MVGFLWYGASQYESPFSIIFSYNITYDIRDLYLENNQDNDTLYFSETISNDVINYEEIESFEIDVGLLVLLNMSCVFDHLSRVLLIMKIWNENIGHRTDKI